MSDTAPKNDAQTPADESKETSSTPPWGDDFDPARAWETITKLRNVERDLKAKVAKFEQEEQERADAEKSELDKAIARAERAEQAALAAKRDAALAKANLPEELHAFVTATDDDGIADQIAKLTAALGASDKGGKEETPSQEEQKPSGRPQAALTPGHGGEEAPFDADAIVAAVL
ncbi:hypothetical protein [Microbacterium sp. XT11]|uniref:hypothetical protein n=1 Tax=Microbacterium sp. XT11 TaxID=367477 RepID=UPI00082C87A1|nr:hypothetical protein [Microbacterium sp. XT11]